MHKTQEVLPSMVAPPQQPGGGPGTEVELAGCQEYFHIILCPRYNLGPRDPIFDHKEKDQGDLSDCRPLRLRIQEYCLSTLSGTAQWEEGCSKDLSKGEYLLGQGP